MLRGRTEPTTIARVHRLWDDVADLGASRIDEALGRVLEELAALVSAQNACWFGAVRLAPGRRPDPIKGWRPRAIRYLHASEADTHAYKQVRRQIESGIVDVSTIANVRDAGTFRANRLVDIVPRSWFKSWAYEVAYGRRHVIDAVFVAAPVNRDAESYFVFHRTTRYPRFTRRERDVLAFALSGVKWFHRQVMLGNGLLVAHAPLSAAEQRVLRLLLTPLSEKEITARLGVSRSTAHGYVTSILRKFGVSSRAGLTALWLGHS